MDLIGSKFLFNDKILDKEEFLKVYCYSSNNVYEVIRIMDSKILFWEDHFKRLKNSIFKFNGKDIEIDDLFQKINIVINVNKIDSGNLKIEFVFDDYKCKLYIYPIKFYYPDKEMGVDVITFNIERENPNIKTYNYDFKTKVQKIINENNVYEILLVNRQGFITEGSRTNVYFIKDNYFFTAPENIVLKGVTRMKVNKIINELGFVLVEESVFKKDIFKFDACFLTSTSSNVLPVNKIDGLCMNSLSNIYLKEVMYSFEEYLKK